MLFRELPVRLVQRLQLVGAGRAWVQVGRVWVGVPRERRRGGRRLGVLVEDGGERLLKCLYVYRCVGSLYVWIYST